MVEETASRAAPQARTRHISGLVERIFLVAFLVSGVLVGIADRTPPASAATTGSAIVAAARAQIGYKASINGTECNRFSAAWGSGTDCGNSTRKIAWCADFAAWAWAQGGITGLYGNGINSNASSFRTWAQAQHPSRWHPLGDGYTPQPGDVAEYSDAHVGIYSGGPVASPTVINGNWWYPDTNTSQVYEQANETTNGKPQSAPLSGYVSAPTGSTGTSQSSIPNPGGGSSAAHVGTKMMADVNGDGRADAVVMFSDTGTAMVALGQANGTFAAPTSWAYGQSPGRKYFLADVNGDGRADLVAFTASGGYWDVSLSSGSGFWAPVQWASNEGSGSSQQFLADVNGDGKADVVYFVAASGNWYVDLSSGSGFWGPPQLWISGHGVGSTTQVVGDFNGDGKADAAIYQASTGSWYVALSNGSSFGYPGQWSNGHGMASNTQLAGDLDGDHRADIAYYYTNGTWEAGTSSGSGFWQPGYWAYSQGAGSDQQFLADVNGDGKADEVTYYNSTGSWYVDLSAGSAFWGPPQLGVSGHGANS